MNYKDFESCGLKRTLDMISGKWKPPILYFLFNNEEIRFNTLWRELPQISKKVLAEHLKQLEEDGLVSKREVDAFPIEVYYSLSKKGKSLGSILSALDAFGSD
ncbi:HxlR family transcriptional regulator [Flavobacteriaceae bacterium MAR_2010_72]|nr:HxlR family transcriptional regulator [Flavobacteriaceae bacterium MAR_2010_72]